MTDDKIIRIKCDVCDKEFACRHTDIARKFGFGSFCSEKCRDKLFGLIRKYT